MVWYWLRNWFHVAGVPSGGGRTVMQTVRHLSCYYAFMVITSGFKVQSHLRTTGFAVGSVLGILAGIGGDQQDHINGLLLRLAG
jgi:hypothetical protein